MIYRGGFCYDRVTVFRAKQFLKEKREEDTAAAIEVIKRYM